MGKLYRSYSIEGMGIREASQERGAISIVTIGPSQSKNKLSGAKVHENTLLIIGHRTNVGREADYPS